MLTIKSIEYLQKATTLGKKKIRVGLSKWCILAFVFVDGKKIYLQTETSVLMCDSIAELNSIIERFRADLVFPDEQKLKELAKAKADTFPRKTSQSDDVFYDPNKLLDEIKRRLHLKNDAAICRLLDVAPPTISKIRNFEIGIGASLLLSMHEETKLNIKELRDLMGDFRSRFSFLDVEKLKEDGKIVGYTKTENR